MELRKKKIVSYNDTPADQKAITLTIFNSKKRRSSARERDVSSVFKIGCGATSAAQSSVNLSRHAAKACIKEELFNESDDELEALGFEIKHQLQSDIQCPEGEDMDSKSTQLTDTEETSDETVLVSENQNAASELTQSTFEESFSIDIKDFVPVNVVTSVLPELFNETFPKLKDQTRKFVCQWCQPDRSNINRYFYSDEYDLVRHYLTKHKEIPVKDYGIQCKDCHAYFFHERRLQMHIAMGTCHEHNIKKDALHKSRTLSMDAFMRVCSFCDMVFLSKKRFQKHLYKDVDGCRFEAIDHPMELGMFDYVKCKFCDEKFLFEDDFQFHVKPWANKQHLKNCGTFKCKIVSRPVLTCKVCLQKYHSVLRHRQHILMDHTIDEHGIFCDRCGKNFYFESGLIEHKESVKNYSYCVDFDACRTIPKRFDNEMEARNMIHKDKCCKCPVCLQLIGAGQRFSQHITKLHPRYKAEWKCCDCEKTFIAVEDYEDHMTKWKCPFCVEDTIFPLKRQLIDHCLRFHTLKPSVELPKVCDICNSTLKNSHALLCHKRTKHHNLKECPFCGVIDTIIKDMYRHINLNHVYTSLAVTERFPCNLCENKVCFRDKFRLVRHIATVHKKAEETECDICHRTYAQRATMLRHRRIHLGIKPFKCDICELSFTQKTGMRAHRARHYNKDGTLKSQDEIQMQVEIVKQQREALKVAPGKDQKKRSRKKEKIACETCGVQFTSKAKFESHPCKQESSEEPSEEEVSKALSTDDGTEIHAPEYDFHCGECDQTYVSAERLRAHRCRKTVKKDASYEHGTDSDYDESYKKYTNKQTQVKESTRTKSGGINNKRKAERSKSIQRRVNQQTTTDNKQSLSRTRTKTRSTGKNLQQSSSKYKQRNTRHSKKSKTSAKIMQKHSRLRDRYSLRRRQAHDLAAIYSESEDSSSSQSLKPQCRANSDPSAEKDNYYTHQDCRTGEPTVDSGNKDSQSGLDVDETVNADSFADVEGGFNCIKCRAMFCDTEIFKYHECKMLKS